MALDFPSSPSTNQTYTDSGKTWTWNGSAWVLSIPSYLSLSGGTVTGDLTLSGTGFLKLPAGTTAQRPASPATGAVRFNSTNLAFEGYNGTAWVPVGGATGGAGNSVFYENDNTVTVNYTLTAGKNAGSFGPITISPGVVVTVPSGARWTIV